MKNTETQSQASLPRMVQHWADLAALPESETHRLEIEVEHCSGWIKDKRDPDALGHYLSTHTFYGSNHEYSTRLLRKCGWVHSVAYPYRRQIFRDSAKWTEAGFIEAVRRAAGKAGS